MGSAFKLGQGEGPIGIVGPISQPHGIIDTASLTLNHTHAFNMRFLLGSTRSCGITEVKQH